MNFFIPLAENDKQADQVYKGIKEFAKDNTGWKIKDSKIFSIDFWHNGKRHYAKVGEMETLTGDLVLAILESNAYLICTKDRGGLRGEPILVGKGNVISMKFFD